MSRYINLPLMREARQDLIFWDLHHLQSVSIQNTLIFGNKQELLQAKLSLQRIIQRCSTSNIKDAAAARGM